MNISTADMIHQGEDTASEQRVAETRKHVHAETMFSML